ncbi:MAG: hypothetical protein Q8K79_20545 [Solirubrobacteraceae bacterium]|nr:hypothetical protein [Solirubrobacteraceae bacterium]
MAILLLRRVHILAKSGTRHDGGNGVSSGMGEPDLLKTLVSHRFARINTDKTSCYEGLAFGRSAKSPSAHMNDIWMVSSNTLFICVNPWLICLFQVG